ncbi:MAG: hypothetical protein ACJATI_000023 [Halioglobus sp.]|jgi:hypothetical protein
MGSAGGMNASIKANAELRRRKRLPFHKVKNGLRDGDYKLQPLSKFENKKIREFINRKILREQYQKRMVGILILIPVLYFFQFLLSLLINWL